MPRDDAQRLRDIVEHAEAAIAKTDSVDVDAFMADDTLHLAVTHLVQIIGEAASRLTDEARDRYAQVPWRQIIAMRNLLVHDYGGVDYRIVWQVVRADLPRLVEAIDFE